MRSEKSKLESFLTDDNVILYSLILRGVPKGFFVLDYRLLPVCDLAYFGLFDDVTGKGLGKFMMNRVFEEVMERGDVKTLTVNTNTLDHKVPFLFTKKLDLIYIKQRFIREVRRLNWKIRSIYKCSSI